MKRVSSGGLLLSFALALVGCGELTPSAPLALHERMLVYGPNGAGPDPTMTPGHLCDDSNAHFDGYVYGAEVAHCRRKVSTKTKIEIAAAYGIVGQDRRNYEIDHYIPLNIGGSNDRRNLWPLIVPLAREKSLYEEHLMKQVKKRRMTQLEAIAAIKSWRPGMTW